MEVFRWLQCSSFTTSCLLVIAMLPLFFTEAPVRTEEVVCRNIDIRNSVNNFEKLRNCTVIEGFLQILLIDNGTSKEYENLSFPALKEITGYLLLFRAAGMTSVGKLFPNLVVIRGSVLFHNFALVIYEMSSLQEIGLHSLTNILRGSVRITKNMDLCYVDTIDWGLIAEAGKDGNFIQNNRDRDQCPDTCLASCPNNPQCPHGKGPLAGDRNCKLCWGLHKCQKVCKECGKVERGTMCSPGNGICCARECLGGCRGPFTSECLVCRHFVYDGKCVESCPLGTYQYLGRRCIPEEKCRSMTDNQKTVDGTEIMYYKPFQGQCLTHCPRGYTETVVGDQRSCAKCKDKCPKTCKSILVDNVASAQLLKGCTTISGSLEIHIQGGSNIITELEENLKDIHEITGYLKIARSTPLISLNFLRDLRYIRGRILDRNEYAFMVLDNQNLQDLWEWKSRSFPLEISGGKIFFHFNGKLCLQKINNLKNTNYSIVEHSWDDRDVSPTSNGDRVPCDVINLGVKVISQMSEIALISWKSFRSEIVDHRALLGYVVYYREAPHRNVTIFDGRDACNTDVWKVEDVNVEDKNAHDVQHLLANLQPYTQYAYYVKAYMTSTAEKGAQSHIYYFQTNASTPTPPLKLEAQSKHPNEVFVSWKPPKHPNGVVTNYTVAVIEKPEQAQIVFQRNYCDEVQNAVDFKKQQLLPEYPKVNETTFTSSSGGPLSGQTSSSFDSGSGPLNNTCCPCDSKKKPGPRRNEKESIEYQIQFEDFLQNMVYVKNPTFGTTENHGRSRRNILSDSSQTSNDPNPLPVSSYTTSSPISSSTPPVDENKVNNVHIVKNISGEMNYYKVDRLKHFTEYAIEVKACQSVDPAPPKEMGCSLNAITTVRTQPLGGADDIPDESFFLRTENVSIGSVYVKWDEPKDPNGMIVSYQIEYKMVPEMSKPIVDCISGQKYNESRGHHLVKLHPGNYSLRVRATSMAQAGNWTRPLFFVVPAVPHETSLDVLWVIVPVILLLLCVLPVGGYYFFKRRFGIGVPDGILYASVNPEYMSAGLVYEADEWEIPREKISMLRELGQGSFGMVYEGEAKDIQGNKFLKCAVKTVNEAASVRERIEFLQEASVMKAFNCHHVVKLLGVVSKGHPTLVVMELMARGDLKSYLRSHRPDEGEIEHGQPPTLRQILQMAIEIADGMAYLAAKKFVHRDLAARNCMVAEELTVKIGDFGMTRDIYETDYYRKGGKGLLPVRWMAPESLKDGVFTSQSDVWSYGVVLWEMATLASQPYQGLSNEQVLKYVINGGMMEKPENCPEKLYALMKMCWHKVPRSRPTFSELIEVLLQDVSGHFREVSFYFTERPKMMASKEEEPSLEVVTSSTPLKSPSALDCVSINSRDNSDDDELDSIRYFPTSSTAFTNGSDSVQCVNGVHLLEEEEGPSTAQLDLNLGGNGRRHVYSNNEGSKGMSLPSSDGSKGSKVSSVSNGSLANGHAAVPFPSARTTTC